MDRASATTYDEALAATYQYFFAESVVHPTDLPTAPTGTGSDPTEFFTEATILPTVAPTAAPSETSGSTATQTAPTVPAGNPAGGNSVLFWILAVVMILGACGAATMAIVMLRKNANADLDEEEDEESIEE